MTKDEALREALEALAAAKGKMPYGPKFDRVVVRIDAAIASVKDALKHQEQTDG